MSKGTTPLGLMFIKTFIHYLLPCKLLLFRKYACCKISAGEISKAIKQF
jgi:hypothetical protein